MSKEIIVELRKNRAILHSLNATGWLIVGAIFFHLGGDTAGDRELVAVGGFVMFFAVIAKAAIYFVSSTNYLVGYTPDAKHDVDVEDSSK